MMRAVLVYLMYGSWGLFEEKCRWYFALHSNPARNSTHPALGTGSDELVRQRCRETCIRFLEASPSHTRPCFIRSEYRCFRWLLHNDKAWLDSQLPINQIGPTQLDFF